MAHVGPVEPEATGWAEHQAGVYVGDSTAVWLNGCDLEAGRPGYKPCLSHVLCWVSFGKFLNTSVFQFSWKIGIPMALTHESNTRLK